MKLQESITGFYYVGNNKMNITKFVSIYKRGYASGNLNQAMAELTRENSIQPVVICCESSFGFTAIEDWAKKISRNRELAGIPFIVNADGMPEMVNFDLMRIKSIDEILNLSEWDAEHLEAKIRFLGKFKARRLELGKMPVEEIRAGSPYSAQNMLKRAFDILLSSFALFFLAPVFLAIAVAIRLESKGSVFYTSKRAGKGYRIFDFYKFRTMWPNADQHMKDFAHLNQYSDSGMARFYKIKDDPRITRVGHFLRNSSLDELPQLINVLLGDMSLVGNRPLPLYEAENLTTDKLAKRFLASAGITGLWQVKKRGKSEMSEDERIGLDIDYADKSNLMMDMWIMAHTPQALLQKANT